MGKYGCARIARTGKKPRQPPCRKSPSTPIEHTECLSGKKKISCCRDAIHRVSVLCDTSRLSTLRYIASQYFTIHRVSVLHDTSRLSTSRYIASQYFAIHRVSVHFASQYFASQYIASQYFAIHRVSVLTFIIHIIQHQFLNTPAKPACPSR